MTPIRRQYLKIKQRYPEAIVLFRLGDFYETFDDDARIVSRELEIVLTSREMGRGQRVPMAGVPHHALNNYLSKLVGKGYKVALCEQLSPPGKGLVYRDVVRVVTPGTIVEDNLLEGKTNNYLVGLIVDGDQAGIAYVDITTSEFAVTQLPTHRLIPELERLQPSEIIVPGDMDLDSSMPDVPITHVEKSWFEMETAHQDLLRHFGVTTLEGFGCARLLQSIRAAGVILRYLRENQKGALDLLTQLSTYSTEGYMVLDAQTRRNLELTRSSRRGGVDGSLLRVIDYTQTSMGGRLLKKWLGQPLLDLEKLVERQEAIEGFYSDAITRGETVALLRRIADLERLVNRVGSGHVTPRELVTLRNGLDEVPGLKNLLTAGSNPLQIEAKLEPCQEAVTLISRAIVDEPPASLEDGNVIRQGFYEELDRLRSASKNARQNLKDMEKKEKERTGIKSLKVGYNRVFGYYIEVTRSNLAQVPEDYIRKQTLAEAERFFTPELKEYESLILSAQDRIAEMESDIFRRVCRQVGGYREQILGLADILAHIDVYSALAEVAVRNNYIRPRLNNGEDIMINGGRHPVVEKSLRTSTL